MFYIPQGESSNEVGKIIYKGKNSREIQAFDALDWLARLVIFLDPIADKLIITAALVALSQRNYITGWTAMLIIGREFIVTGFRLIAVGEGIILPADKWGKLKMVIQSVAISLALLKNFPLSTFTDFPFDKIALFAAVLITVFSGFNYIWKNKNIINTF